MLILSLPIVKATAMSICVAIFPALFADSAASPFRAQTEKTHIIFRVGTSKAMAAQEVFPLPKAYASPLKFPAVTAEGGQEVSHIPAQSRAYLAARVNNPSAAASRPSLATHPAVLRGEQLMVRYIQALTRHSEAEATMYARYTMDACLLHEVDPLLMTALFIQESGYQPMAVSSAGAMGIGQLMPETAKKVGVHNPFDPRDNINGATRHMAGLLEDYGNSSNQLILALADYNAGADAVSRYGGVPPYRETVNYVRSILSMYSELRSHYSAVRGE